MRVSRTFLYLVNKTLCFKQTVMFGHVVDNLHTLLFTCMYSGIIGTFVSTHMYVLSYNYYKTILELECADICFDNCTVHIL